MTPRDELIKRWQARLADTQSPSPGDAPHGQWVRQVYARIYRFLLACYAHAPWPTEPTKEKDTSSATVASEKLLSTHEGKQPKAAGQIGKALKSIHAANEHAVVLVAPPAKSIRDEKREWIRAAEFARRQLAWRFHRLLRREGIEARVIRRTGHFFVDVRRGEFDAALAVLDALREEMSAAAGKQSAAKQEAQPSVLSTYIVKAPSSAC